MLHFLLLIVLGVAIILGFVSKENFLDLIVFVFDRSLVVVIVFIEIYPPPHGRFGRAELFKLKPGVTLTFPTIFESGYMHIINLSAARKVFAEILLRNVEAEIADEDAFAR